MTILEKMIQENREAIERNEIVLGWVSQEIIKKPEDQDLKKSRVELTLNINAQKVFLEYLERKNESVDKN